jgi:betaine reductase
VIAKEIEREGLPVALITSMTKMAAQVGANRIVTGVKIPHPCGNPDVPAETDLALRREIVKCALRALQAEIDGPTVFIPEITFVSG